MADLDQWFQKIVIFKNLSNVRVLCEDNVVDRFVAEFAEQEVFNNGRIRVEAFDVEKFNGIEATFLRHGIAEFVVRFNQLFCDVLWCSCFEYITHAGFKNSLS